MRAPQTRMPRPGKARMQLTPIGLSRSCSPRVIWISRSTAPRTTSLAGALCTPRSKSLRAQMPATWPLGGISRVWPVGRVEDLDPGVVQGRVLGVVAGRLLAPDPDLPGVEAGRRVDDGDAVAHQLAVRDQAELDGLDGLQVDRAALVGGHQVGDGDHGDLVDGLQAAEAGAVGGVAEVLGRAGLGRPPPRVGGTAAGAAGAARATVWLSGRTSCAAGAASVHGDELGALLHLRDDVVAAALLGGHVEGLDGLVAVLDDQLEALGGALALGVARPRR